ncbi:hypothetical protein PANDA_017931, partial [Ailuropoda melanoleuca]
RSFNSLVKFIPTYFIVFDDTRYGINFFISFSENLLLVYRNAVDFCMLILYPATSLNLLIRSNSFLVESLRFSLYNIMSSANRDNFTSSFPILMPFISLSYLIALAGTSSTMLNKSGESGHPCLIPDLRRKAFNFSPLSMILTVGLSYMAFIMWRYIFSIPNLLRIFIMNGC